MKKLFTIIFAVLFIGSLFAVPAMACDDGDCVPTLNADIQGGVEIHGTITIVPGDSDTVVGTYVQDPSSGAVGGNFGTADVVLNADAVATSADSYKRVWVQDGPHWWNGHHEYRLVPGEAEAYGRNDLNLTSSVDINSNSPQISGLASTEVKATTTLDIDGVAWAEGTKGCLQEASIDLDGSLSAYAYGNSFSGDLSGAFASAGGSGLTTVDFVGHESDSSTYGSFFGFGPNKAYVDFDSTISAEQEVYTESEVSLDGTMSRNYAFVGGGNAQLDLGRDLSGRDNIDLTGIEASGQVGQSGMALDGSSFAYGNSHAFFSGAYGSVESIPGHCWSSSPGQIATVGGYAEVSGYNNVSIQPNMVTVTSEQHAYATTGNSGPAPR